MNGIDVVVVSAPGSGKIIIIAILMLVAQERGENGISIVIVPSKILAEQRVSVRISLAQSQVYKDCTGRYAKWLRFFSLAINEDTLRTAKNQSRDLFREITDATGVRVAVMTPWMLSSERFHNTLLTKKIRPMIR